MHYIPDTEDEDSAAESFWPEGYKQVIREDVRQFIGAQLKNKKQFSHVYQKQYHERFSSHGEFLDKIADMVAIGAENGADDAFDEITDAFLTESAFPEMRRHTYYLWPQAFPKRIKERLRQVIVDEYREDEIYSFAYKVGYRGDYGGEDAYLDQVAEIVITGTMNGANDTVEAIYQSFMKISPLSPARRHPRRLRMLRPEGP